MGAIETHGSRRSHVCACPAFAARSCLSHRQCSRLLPLVSASAQETRGTILGTVKDQAGGVLAGMVVVVTNEETNVAGRR